MPQLFTIKKLSFLLLALLALSESRSEVSIQTLQDARIAPSTFNKLAKEVESRTSLSLGSAVTMTDLKKLSDGWLWVEPRDLSGSQAKDIFEAVRRGVLLIVEGKMTSKEETRSLDFFPKGLRSGLIRTIALDHTMMRSFHLLKRLPTCGEATWNEIQYDQRTAVILIPVQFLSSLSDSPNTDGCLKEVSEEERTRIFINLLMFALTMDYKNDQIHLPEILKRIR